MPLRDALQTGTYTRTVVAGRHTSSRSSFRFTTPDGTHNQTVRLRICYGVGVAVAVGSALGDTSGDGLADVFLQFP